ncbi:MAG: peptidoglycan DD-metalloendopeptidase family protein [Clostridia bacterium]|nr:peptidoglycan DD-metalloendopeptidase family protein [Clostridia bacterium]
MKKKFVCALLLVIIIISSNIVSTLAATKSELKEQQSQISGEIENTENEIAEVKKEISQTMEQIQSLTSEIAGYEAEIEKLDGQLADLEESILETQQKLEEAEKKYIEQEENLEARIVAQYEAGETTYLDVLLGGGSLWDMISNWQMVSDIAEMDNRLLEKIEQNRIEIEEAKKSLETNKEQVEVIKTNKEATAKTLKNSQATKEQYASKLSEDEKALNEELELLKAENKKITNELQALENKYSDKIANLGGNGTLQRPVKSGVITATMYYSSGIYHGALDYGIPIGTEVYAAAEGVVLAAGWSNSGYGNYVCLQHSNGMRTYYAHGNGKFYVEVGDVVARGELIMLSGNSGRSTGPHLHFEVRVSPYNWFGPGDSRRDPRNYL